MKKQILFDHFLDGIRLAGYDLYDLHPIACKKFSSDDVVKLFRQFESKVCEDPFWEKSDEIMFINGDSKLENLDFQNETYYILNDQYRTDTAYEFFNANQRSWFCPTSQARPHIQSCERWYDGVGVSLEYCSLSSRFFKYYGEDFYMKSIHPHTEIFKSAIVDIFGLKKFPEDIIKKNKLEDIEDDIASALETEEYDRYIEKAGEYLEVAKSICPELENHPTYQEILSLNEDFKKIVERALASSKSLEEIITKVKSSI
jgi:hypothetical protein